MFFMNDSKKSNKVTDILNKLKFSKNIQILGIVLSVCLIIFLFFSSNTDLIKNTTDSVEYFSTTEYIDCLEIKLGEILSQIKGAGNVKAMITIECNSEKIYGKRIIIHC